MGQFKGHRLRNIAAGGAHYESGFMATGRDFSHEGRPAGFPVQFSGCEIRGEPDNILLPVFFAAVTCACNAPIIPPEDQSQNVTSGPAFLTTSAENRHAPKIRCSPPSQCYYHIENNRGGKP